MCWQEIATAHNLVWQETCSRWHDVNEQVSRPTESSDDAIECERWKVALHVSVDEHHWLFFAGDCAEHVDDRTKDREVNVVVEEPLIADLITQIQRI